MLFENSIQNNVIMNLFNKFPTDAADYQIPIWVYKFVEHSLILFKMELYQNGTYI